MNASSVPAVEHRSIPVGDVSIHVAVVGDGPVVLFLHGFPETWYSWRYQLPAVAAAGYRAVAMDLRGGGRSSCPERLEDYDIEHLTADVVGVLDHLDCGQAVLVGHDWGGSFVWDIARLAPERVAGVVGMVMPRYLDRLPRPPVEMNREQYGERRFMHVLYFQEPGVADDELARDVRRSLLGFYWLFEPGVVGRSPFAARRSVGGGFLDGLTHPPTPPPWLGEDDLTRYVAEFERTGFTGQLNFYRCMDRNWRIMQPYRDVPIEVPALYVTGSWDEASRWESVQAAARRMRDVVPRLHGWIEIQDSGHYLQQSAPDAVNIQLLGFLAGIGRGF